MERLVKWIELISEINFRFLVERAFESRQKVLSVFERTCYYWNSISLTYTKRPTWDYYKRSKRRYYLFFKFFNTEW